MDHSLSETPPKEHDNVVKQAKLKIRLFCLIWEKAYY